MPDIKAVIFDLDGTLYNYRKSDAAASEALGRYIEEHFGPSSVSTPEGILREIKECWDIQNDRIGFLCGATHSRLIRCQVMCERHGWPVHPHALRMAETYWNAFLSAMVPENGIREFLEALRKTGVDIGIGSNMTSYIQYRKLMQINLFGYFDRVTMSEETGSEKPNRKFFEICARKAYLRYSDEGLHETGLSNVPDITEFMSRCLFIGDTPEMDYFGPLRAGMKSCLYLADNPVPANVAPDHIIRSYADCLTANGVRIGPYYIPSR